MKNIWQIIVRSAGIFVDVSPKNKPKSPGTEADEHLNRIALSTWLVLLAGIVIVFGFQDSLVTPVVRKTFGQKCRMNSFASWELGALVWNAVFAIYFYLKVPLTEKRWVERFTSVAVLFGVGGSTFMALLTLLTDDATKAAQHVFYVLLIGIVFLVIDGLHAVMQKDRRQRREFEQCLLLADLPMVPALAVLCYYQHVRGMGDVEKLDIFLSGAISFQLIASTLIFACIQAGVFNQVLGRWFKPEHSLAAGAQ